MQIWKYTEHNSITYRYIVALNSWYAIKINHEVIHNS